MPESDYSLPVTLRMKQGAEFERVYEFKKAKGDQHLLLFAVPNSLDVTRFGVSVSRKVGNAVRRARLKRCMREAFRLCQHEIHTGYDLILIPRRETNAGTAEFQKSLMKLTHKLDRMIKNNPANH